MKFILKTRGHNNSKHFNKHFSFQNFNYMRFHPFIYAIEKLKETLQFSSINIGLISSVEFRNYFQMRKSVRGIQYCGTYLEIWVNRGIVYHKSKMVYQTYWHSCILYVFTFAVLSFGLVEIIGFSFWTLKIYSAAFRAK